MGSPLDRRASPLAQPSTWKTNVNRAKTKRWVEAKSYAYDGDDWGEADEFDEYGAPNEQPNAANRPSGLRQKGQAPQSPGSLPPEQSSSQSLNRQRSFDPGDERRAFSSGAPPPMAAADPSISSIQGNAQRGPNTASRPHPTVIPPNQARARRTDSLGWDNASNASMGSSSVDFQQRRDFSPSAMPPPLATRPSPASSLPENGPGTRYPPRKSSLSQQSPVQPVSAAGESSAGSGPRQMSPIAGSGPDAEESSSKPLPFIRPADIYKRIEEERQKERASTDSERPSIDSLAQAAREPRSRSSSGSFSRSAVRKPSFERNENSPFTPSRTPLEPVQERKSVFEPFETSEGPANAQTASAAETLQVDSKSIEPDASSSASAHVDTNSSRPMLPQIDPSSAFGDDIWRMTEGSEQAMPTHTALQDTNQPEQAAPVEPKNEKSSDNLQHHPSLGFRSVVNQAFDRHDDRSVPPTPVSSQDPSLSRGGSEVSRSNTDSTAGISPIMSRASSAAANTTRIQALDGRDYSTPAIAEEPDNLSLLETRRTSSGTLTAAQQIPRKPSPSHSRQASDETAKGFIPGYRRNLDPPSSENSPARTPNVEGNKQIALPEAGQLSTAMHGDELVDRPDSTKSFGRENEVYAGTSTEGLPDPNSSTERLPQSPIDRAESPSKGRVRDLAGRFNDLQSSSNRSSTDSLKLKQSNQMENSDSQVSGISNTASVFESEQSRPKIVPESRSESARPLLPGGWVSYAPSEVSVSGTGDVHNPGVAGDRIKPPINSTDAANPLIHDGDIPNMNKSGAPDLEPPNPRAAVGGDSPDKTTDPIAAVTAAGSAIAASLTQSGDPNQEATEATRENEDTQPALRHPAIGDIYVRPLAPDRNASSAATSPAPTPLPKDTPPATASKLGPDYFATPGPSNDQTTARAGAPTLLHTNTDDSLQEYESERLRKEITRQLSPEASDDLHNGNVADSRDDQPESPQSPDSDRSTTQSRQNGKGKSAGSSGVEGQPLHLAHKFSWESDGNIPDSPEELGPIQPELRAEGNRPPESLIESSGGVQETNTEKSLPYLPEPGFGQPNLSDEATRNLQSLEPIPADSESDILQQTTADSAPPIDTVQHTQHAPHPVSGGAQPSTANARIPPFREILAMKVATDRVSTYNRTRDQFANLNTGLTDWVTATLAASPEYAALTSSEARAAQPVVTTATARHRHSPSLMKLGKLPTTGHSHQQSISSNFVNDEDVMTASSPTKPVQGSTGRVTSHQVQAKGKDLLKNAGALGGKATTGAKGLFAKGRNKLQNRGSDKAPSPSSDSPPTRRFIPSRRSRPSSLAMTTKDTSAFKSIDSAAAASVTPPRPQSYAAPESWSKIPVSRVQSPSRLGVLPSPARSTFTKLCDTESEGKDEITEQAILDSIVRNASPPPISLPNSRGLHKKSPKNGESEKPNQNVSAISLLPSQQRSATESKKQRADPELYSSRNASSTHSNLTDAQADARPALRETPRVEEPSPPTDTRNNMVSEETSARPSDNTEKAVRRTSGSDLSPPVEALRAEGPIRTQRSSVSSIDVEPSKDKLDPKDSSSPRGFTHRRQVSALDDEGNVSSEVKATSNSHNTNSSKSERLPANNGGIDTQVSPLHSLDANSQPSPEARNRAQQYFARSIPDRPSSPPVHPALRDSYDEFALQDKPQRYQYHEDQSLSHASANTSVRQPMLYPSSPQDARQGYDQAGPRSQNESGYQSSQHPPHQSEVRYGPFPPQTQDGSRQYAPNEMSGPPVAVTSDAMQQRPVDRSSISTTPVQFQRPSPQRRMSPGVNAQLSSTRYRQPSGDLSRDFPNGPGYSQGDSGPSTNPSNVPSGAAGQYRHSGAPLHTHISAPASASPVQEHQARGYFRGPTNSSIAPNSRPSAWESIGAQRSEVRRDERYASGPLGAATNPRVDDATQDATLRRAATSSKTEGGKKKRFSMLGNLFSRSGSTGHAPKQTNKLTKVKSSRRSQALPASPSVQQWAQGSSAFGSTQYPTITAPVAGPRGTESMTFGPEWQRNAQSRGRAHQPQSPPAEGYYAPSRIRESETIHPQGAPVQNYYGVPQDQYDAAGPPTQSYFEGHSSPPRRTSNSQSPIWPSSQDTNSFPSRSQSYNTAYSHQQPPRPHPRHSSTSSQQYPLSPATTTTSASLTTPPLDSPSSHSAHVVSPLLPTTNPMLANPSFAPPHAIYAPQQAPEYQRDQRAYQMQQQEQHQQQGRRGGDGGRARGRWGSIGSAVGARAPLVRGQYEGQQQTPWELQMPEENVGRMERRDEGHGGYGWQGQGQRWQGRHESQGGQGYARGRRVGEEEVVMRGASYPGQEWAPEGLAHGWD